MQIELIATASEDSAFLPRLGLGVLAALTPAEDEVIYTDDLVKPFDIARDVKDVDLVGISVDSKTASRSYAIAQAYRQRGVKVVLGGIHPTALPDEALQFADAVVVSEAEDLWPKVVEDVRNDRLQRIYRGELPDLSRPGRPLARQDTGHGHEVAAFVRAAALGTTSPVSWDSILNTSRATLAVLRSLESGGPVHLP